MIPRIIHQLWIGPKPVPDVLMNTWKQLNPDWQYMFWDEKTISEFFPNGLKNQRQYEEMTELCGKCDIARYEILEKFGGFFIDADSICINKLDDYLLVNDSFSCYENELERGMLVAVGYLASTRNNSLIKLLISGIGKLNIMEIISREEADPSRPQYLAWRIVGSEYLTKTIARVRYNRISIYPSYFFIPEHYSGTRYSGPAKSYAKQLWGSTRGSSFEGYDLSKITLV
jgi:mannosyltransferase OCH1-like enzyme